MKVETFLRLRPLELRHKLKEDYFTLQNKKKDKVKEEKKGKYNTIIIHDPLKKSKD